ncbi:MAG: radical SAM family heme chaperone HemW [Bacteroidales bacterium]|nr:radical SAM family heme chaperone HemW [Bacteroidales bacterium]
MAGIYVHFPFCAAKCIYCDFYSRVRRDWKPYVEALLKELSERSGTFLEKLQGVPPSTLYYGGGTPSLLPSYLLERIAEAVTDTFGGTPPGEFTIEVNPDDITPAKAAELHSMGVNRVSMGVQSFSDEHLKWMRRRHTAAGAIAAFDTLRKAGFGNLSLDLIFGFTGLDDGRWAESIDRALVLQPEHISCYQMTGRWADPDEERCRRQYMLLRERLEAAGIRQYEVSNYARPGFESRHNSSYWAREAYLGLGAGAHSFDGDRTRSWNTPDIDAYVGSRPCGEERLSDREILEEKLMLSLRTVKGLDLAALSGSERGSLKKTALEELSRAGKLFVDSDSIRIPGKELFVSDWIISRLFPEYTA